MGVLRRIGAWFSDRLGLPTIIEKVFHHEIPAENAWTRKGWYHVFGAAIIATFVLQIVTGSALATKYIPSPADAHRSLVFITEQVTLGAFLRALHFFGASAMVLLVFVHMTRVFLTGSYKYPRELNWLSGVVLLVLVLAMAFTGQLLRWDEDGVWTVMVAATFAGRVPFIGQQLMDFILAGESVGGATLSRFFGLHVIILPLLTLAVIALHVYLVFHVGISEPPKPGRRIDRKTYRAWYAKLSAESGARYWPDAAWREMVFIGAVYASVIALALVFGPKGPGSPPDPTRVVADPRPDWYFRWYYTLLWLKPRGWDTLVMVYLPLFLGFLLLVLPFAFNRGERAPQRRPWAVGLVAILFLGWATMTVMGFRARWVPRFVTEPPPAEVIGVSEGPIFEGSRIFHARGCQYCHRVLGYGGIYGPDLTDVARRMSPEEITVRTMVGVRNMPAYREILTLDELARIQAYLAWIAHRSEE